MSTETGGPAFPTTKPLESWGDPNAGMTLRDYFAAKAMQGIMDMIAGGKHTVGSETPVKTLAEQSYAQADAMLSAREQTK